MAFHHIARYLPNPDEVARILAYRARPHGRGLLGMLGLGALMGAAGALLLAPKPGTELRRDLARRAGDLREGFRHGGDGRDTRSSMDLPR